MALHPSVAAVRSAVRRSLAGLPKGATVLVACSGGADSLALLGAAVFEGRKAGLRVVGVTVDHQLQDGSATLAQHVADQMRALGADESVVATVSVDAPGMGPEAAARRARYDVLGELRTRLHATLVLLGHTRDDQAETVLMGLTRGSGVRSLAGMRRSFDGFVRPLLDVTRTDTETACLTEGVEWWTDPHNADPRFTRVRLRTRILPMLEDELGPGVAATLARTADQARADVAYLDAVAETTFREVADERSIPVDALAALPEAIRRRVLRLAAVAAGSPAAELFHEHVVAVDELVTAWRGQKWIDLPGHLRAVRRDGRIGFEPSAELLLVASTVLDPSARAALRELWDAAFAGGFTDEDAGHAFGGTHAIVRTPAGELLAHASVVPRELVVGDRSLRGGYVEAVATRPGHQRRGLGSRVMAAIAEVVREHYELGALSTSAHGFYERLGWERWRGPSYVIRAGTRVRTPEEDDGVMVLPVAEELDRTQPIACHDRPGDAW
jgi:tRNA(Ile)-lysidine synthase